MSDFARALQDAERELFRQAGSDGARRRVAVRLRERPERSALDRMRLPALALAVCGLCVGVGYWIATPSEKAGEEAVAVAPDEHTSPDAKPGGGLRDPAAPPAVVPTTGQLLAEQVGGSCEFFVGAKAFGDMEELDVALPAGAHDVVCRRGLQSQHQRLEIVAGKTTRVIFRFGANTVEEPGEDPSPDADKGDRGTLVGIAIGGSCRFTVDGEDKGIKSSFRVKIAVGPHVVGCEVPKGKLKTQTVVVAEDKPGIASFRIDSDDTFTPPSPKPTPTPKKGEVLNPWAQPKTPKGQIFDPR
jgi:hypothetical protein